MWPVCWGALGVDPFDAILTLESFGYTPLQVCGLLWGNGYAMETVRAGVMRVMEADSLDRTLALAKTFQRMMDCSGELSGLPICASGQSTFTEQDLLDFLRETLLPGGMTCTGSNRNYCLTMFQMMLELDFDVAFTVDHLVREFGLPIEETGWMLRAELGYAPKDLTSFYSAAPFHLSIQQIAPILEVASRKAGYYYQRVFDHLFYDITGKSLEQTMILMRDGGFRVEILADLMLHFGLNRQQTIVKLWHLGYSWSYAVDIVYKVRPVTLEEIVARMHRALSVML